MVVHHVDLAAVQIDIASITNVVGKGGVVLLSLSGKLVQQCVTGFSLRDPDSGVEVEDIGVEPLTLAALARKFSSIPGSIVQMSGFVDGKALLYAKLTQPTLCVPSGPFKTIIVQHFKHGREGELVEIANNISSEAELWITGNDDAGGIGALGVASCIIAESHKYQVFSVLFEEHSLGEAAHEKIVHDLWKNSLLLEQHMKIGENGDVFVRQLVHGGAEVKQVSIPATGLTGPSSTMAAYFPPILKPSDVEIEVKALGIKSGATSKSALTSVGVVKYRGASVAHVDIGAEVRASSLRHVPLLRW